MSKKQPSPGPRDKAIQSFSELIAGVGESGLTAGGRAKMADQYKATITAIVDDIIAAARPQS